MRSRVIGSLALVVTAVLGAGAASPASAARAAAAGTHPAISSTQQDLETALRYAVDFYTTNNQTYTGLTPAELHSLDPSLTVVGPSTASTAPAVVSLATTPDGTAVVLAGAGGPDAVCWSIVMATAAGDQLDGRSGWGTFYIELAEPGVDGCDAARFDQVAAVAGSTSSGRAWGAAAGRMGAESDLQTALTGAKTYYTQHQQTYDSLTPKSFAQVDTGLAFVDGTTPSKGEPVVSMHVTGSFGSALILAAAASREAACWAIVSSTASNELDGLTGPATLYIELPHAGTSGCEAILFNRRQKPAGSYTSTSGFSGLPVP